MPSSKLPTFLVRDHLGVARHIKAKNGIAAQEHVEKKHNVEVKYVELLPRKT